LAIHAGSAAQRSGRKLPATTAIERARKKLVATFKYTKASVSGWIVWLGYKVSDVE
jgi:hypothetical protein